MKKFRFRFYGNLLVIFVGSVAAQLKFFDFRYTLSIVFPKHHSRQNFVFFFFIFLDVVAFLFFASINIITIASFRAYMY